MMAQTKYKIGEFSRLGRVTVKTLRHYEKIGLLKPGIVDMWTGYRYYSPDQLQRLLSIVQLKQLGFSLAEITELYENDTHYPNIRALEAKIRIWQTVYYYFRKWKLEGVFEDITFV